MFVGQTSSACIFTQLLVRRFSSTTFGLFVLFSARSFVAPPENWDRRMVTTRLRYETTRALLKEMYQLVHNPEVFIARHLPFSRRRAYSYAPEVEEVEARPFRENRMPEWPSLSYPLDRRHRIVDVEGRRLEERTTGDRYKVDENLSKTYLVIGIFYHIPENLTRDFFE
jgi:hypothetical protein